MHSQHTTVGDMANVSIHKSTCSSVSLGLLLLKDTGESTPLSPSSQYTPNLFMRINTRAMMLRARQRLDANCSCTNASWHILDFESVWKKKEAMREPTGYCHLGCLHGFQTPTEFKGEKSQQTNVNTSATPKHRWAECTAYYYSWANVQYCTHWYRCFCPSAPGQK